MIRLLCAVTLAAGLCAASSALANAIPDLTLEQEAAQSDTVIVGEVRALQKMPNGDQYVEVSVRTVLKGTAPSSVDVWTFTGVSEMDPRCETIGASYVFFLQRGSDGKYNVVAGYHGARLIPQVSETWKWPM